MSNPLSPGVSVKGKLITSRVISGPMRGKHLGNALPVRKPASKQGNVTGGSVFSARGPNESKGGTSDSYRVAPSGANAGRYARGDQRASGTQGFGAVKRPANPAGSSPRGVFPAKKHGNFGRV